MHAHHSVGQQGFVLVTGLIFLALITLLAVTTLGNVNLEERAASNLRDRGETLIAADAGLRHGESFLALQTQLLFPEDSPLIWAAGGPLDNPNQTVEFLDKQTWDPARSPVDKRSRVYGEGIAGTTPIPGRNNDPLSPARLFVEDFRFQPDDLSVESTGKRIGDTLYRVTAHAEGSSESTDVTVQSTYRKRYN